MGKAALLKEHNSGPRERFVPLLLEDAGTADALYCSSVLQGKEVVGLVGSGGYGHSIGKSIALAYVRTDLAKPGMALDVEIFGERRRAVVAQEPLYDPTNARLRM
jgi:dimethylglycine dehydrogenase